MLISKKLSTFFGNKIPSHTHTRGSMNITGGFYVTSYKDWDVYWSGAFKHDSWSGIINEYPSGNRFGPEYISFDASRSWTGETY